MKKAAIVLAALSVAAILFACGGQKNPPEGATPAQPQAPATAAPGAQQPAIPPMGKTVVQVPDVIKGKWKGVVLVIEDKEKKSRTDAKVNIGESYKVPGSDLTVTVKEFFPSFVMQGASITSTSNEQNNPAASIAVQEGGKEIFSGWLFANYPTTHAFTHPKFGITLKAGTPR